MITAMAFLCNAKGFSGCSYYSYKTNYLGEFKNKSILIINWYIREAIHTYMYVIINRDLYTYFSYTVARV